MYELDDTDLGFFNLPNGVLIRDMRTATLTFVPDISYDQENDRFVNLPKRRPVLTPTR